MDLAVIKEIMQAFDESGIYKMKLEYDELELELEKAPIAAAATQVVMAPVTAPAAPVAPIAAAPVVVDGTEVKSPIVGVFYPASSPEAEPYAKIGQSVKKGDTLCIIEAMKVMNEVPAPCDGVVTAINVEREDLVEFGQVIMVIK